jgi:aspartate ammonia-lyase
MTEAITLATTETISLKPAETRVEHDLLGDTEVPSAAYWGVHTKRAVENFPITGVPVGHFPELVRVLAIVKQAAARANRKLGHLPQDKALAICRRTKPWPSTRPATPSSAAASPSSSWSTPSRAAPAPRPT